MVTASSSLVEEMETDVTQETNKAKEHEVQNEHESVRRQVNSRTNAHHSSFTAKKFRAMFDYSLSTSRYPSLPRWSSSDQLQKKKRLIKHPFYIDFSHAFNNQPVLYDQAASANGQLSKRIIR
ncbi:unnamed protein product [Adineta ricciae]|uniref:Uncharacterized protein n=1 Tax=Adineta ricciae TaxID=249248 RepID=A0A815VKM4_ADIRI|nr:unnamed protein product [Adineta ricciae]